jgi:hypothetical protein
LADRIRAGLTAAQGRKFAFTVGGAFFVFAAITWWRRAPDDDDGVRVGSAARSPSRGLVAPTALGPVERAWMGLAHLISKVTTPIFMGVVFYVVITPVSVLMTLLGKRPLRNDPKATTYWHTRPEGERRSDLSRQF